MTIIHQLIRLYNSLPPGNTYRNLISILLENIDRVPLSSLEEMSEICCCSTITINRLLKKINCSSFRAFKDEIRNILYGYEKFNRPLPYGALSAADMEGSYLSFLTAQLHELPLRLKPGVIDAACAAIHQAGDIHIYCEYATGHSKQQFQMDLMLHGKHVDAFSEIHEQIQDAQKLSASSIVIATSSTILQYYPTHLMLMKDIHTRNIPTIIIAPYATPNAEKYAGYLLEYPGSETAMDNYMVDIIFNFLCITYRAKYID